MTKRMSTSHALAVACALVLAGAGCAAGDAAAPQSAAPAETGPRMRTVEANGIKLRIAEMGQGPLVIFLHGFPLKGFVKTVGFQHVGHGNLRHSAHDGGNSP